MKNLFRDKTGKIVIIQKPNLPIIVWFIAFIISKLNLPPVIIDVVAAISFGALFTWAWLEIFDGTNIFRRILGGVVMVGLLYFSVIN